MYTTGAIEPYIASYYGVPNSKLQYLLPCIIIVNSFFVLFGSSICQKYNPKVILLCGGLFGAGCIFLSSFCQQFEVWFIVYTFSYAIGNGTTYIVPVHHGWLWWPERPGLVSGVILAGFGFSQLVFNNMAMALVNPDHEAPNSDH